jgi:UDP-N-acetylglucosamine 1-carboxyvinyltransferase
MAHLKIVGGTPLRGEVPASGSKNAALPMMAAAILADEPVRLEGVPRLADVDTLSHVLTDLGLSVARTPDEGLVLQTVDSDPVCAKDHWVRRLRASFCVLGPLLARRGRAKVPLPGGCKIGDRPVDLHLKGLAALGTDLRLEHGYVVAQARRLQGADIELAGPHGATVTGTANVLAAAVLARGTTTITGAAREPEIVDLGNFLLSMGAQISGLGTSTLRVTGVEQLGGTTYRVIPDRIEAATLLLAAAITRGSATVTGVVPEHLSEVLDAIRATGSHVDLGPEQVTIMADGRPRPIEITARPYPGVPTDLQAQLTALLCLARGRSTVGDAVFGNRFLHLAELRRMGAQIERRNSTAIVMGVEHLTGASVTASDLRASAALVLAGLAAEGHTTVDRLNHLDRGYQQLDEKLGRLGAQIEREESAA